MMLLVFASSLADLHRTWEWKLTRSYIEVGTYPLNDVTIKFWL